MNVAILLRTSHPLEFARAFTECAGLLYRHRQLAIEMTRRELADQYAGQVFGAFWAIVHPLFMMALYIFIFTVVFKQRIGGTYELPLDYTAYILAGLVPWLSMQHALTRSSNTLTGQANLVKQVVFPLEILPTRTVLASFVPMLIGLTVLLCYVFATHGLPSASYLLLPILLIFHFLAMLGIAFALSVMGVFLRDLKDFVQMIVMAGIYLLPIVYLPAWVPALFKPLLYLNPFSYAVWCYQDALYFGRFEHPWAWLVFGAGSVFLLAAGYRLFRRLKPHLGDVI